MDAYEATRVVFSRIQSLDPDNAAKVMGLLLIKDHGEKEMIRLAFVAEPILRSIVLAARKELGLPQQASSPVSAVAPPFLLGCNNSTRLGSSLPSPTSWAPPPVFSSNSGVVNGCGGGGGAMDDFECAEELLSPSNTAAASSPLYGANGGNDLIHEFHLQDQLSFLNEGGGASNSGAHGLHMISKNAGELFYQDIPAECRSPSGQGAGMFPSSIAGWPPAAASGAFHRRSCSAAADLYGGAAAGADPGFGWKPCLYFARGYCKNGSSCRFLHGIPDDTAVGGSIDAADAGLQQQCQEFLRRSKSPRQLMASAFPFSPTGPLPELPPGGNKFMNFLLQHQNESQRTSAAAAVAAARFLLGGVEDSHTSIGRGARMMERSDFAAGMGSPSSRQIYLTFPADSTFREEDVSNYFSIYGPVQDVRIPYQQKRMFGFVTFLYPETVKLILAKGNPHFVCDARVLVKPYKEKGKVADKYRKQQQYPLVDRGEFYGSSALTGLDSGDSFQFPQLGARMLYHEALLNRRLEEQQQAEELQRAIELQSKRFIGLQLTDTKTRSQFNPNVDAFSSPAITLAVATAEQENSNVNEDKGSSPPRITEATPTAAAAAAAAATVAKVESPKEDISIQESSVEHNLPDNPFASPTKADSSSLMGDSYSSSMLPTEDTFVSAVLDRGSGNSNRFIESSLSPVASPLRHCMMQPMLLPNS